MENKNRVTVTICDRNYTVVANEPLEYIHKIAGHVDKIMRGLLSKNPNMTNTMAAILTAMNSADEHYKHITELDKLRSEHQDEEKQLVELRRRMNEITRENERIKGENERLKGHLQKNKTKSNTNNDHR